ncbi:MAG: hypothetical protein QOE66_320, partial [Chloroflexota bacterium]|nr:hypothetical protein [Chloroflexota bacterium]
MTFVGRILVLVITALSLVFLGVSTVVFSTATNWKQATEKLKKDVSDQQSKANVLKAELTAAQTNYAGAQASHKVAMKQQEDKVAQLQSDLTRTEGEIKESRTELEVAQQNAKMALEEAGARKSETDLLRDKKL